MAKFRYMVSDAAAAAFYTENFGFSIELQVPAILYCLSGTPLFPAPPAPDPLAA